MGVRRKSLEEESRQQLEQELWQKVDIIYFRI